VRFKKITSPHSSYSCLVRGLLGFFIDVEMFKNGFLTTKKRKETQNDLIKVKNKLKKNDETCNLLHKMEMVDLSSSIY